MRANINVDAELLAEAMDVLGQPTRRATVEAALRDAVVRARRKKAIVDMVGIPWEGDLDAMRASRFDPE